MSNFIKYKNIQIYFTDEGSGQPIVLLHGFLENSTMWNNLKPHLSTNTRVVSITFLGHGKTECLESIHTMEDMATAVHHVLAQLNVNNCILIGHSMGGYVALAFAKLFSSQVSGLCLMNSTYKADDEALKLLRTRANELVKNNFNMLVKMSFTNLFAPQSRIIHKEAIKSALSEALKTSVIGYIAAQEGMRIRFDSKNVFKQLKCKKLIVIGEKDTVIDGNILKKEAIEMQTEIVEFPDGHMSHIENNEDFTYNIVHFIEYI